MPADFSTPTLATAYTAYLSDLKERDTDALTLCYAGDPSNIPTGAIKYNRGADKFQQWSGSAWVDLILSVVGGGTGGSSASSARTALGLGSMSIQDSTAISVTGGSISSGASVDAGAIKSGTVAQARLGSGSGGAGDNFLADNQTWKPAVSVLTGTGIIWFTNTPPSGYLICDGSAISRTVYSDLFAVLGTTYGVGDGSTTFNLPDLRQKFPIGKAASGTANTLAASGGAIDHTHSSAAHTHAAGSLAGPSHSHTVDAHGHTSAAHSHSVGINVNSGGPNSTINQIDQTGGGANTVALGDHIHLVSVVGNTDSTTPGDTGLTSPGTNASGTGAVTGVTSSTTPGATGTNNPPYLVINYCVKF